MMIFNRKSSGYTLLELAVVLIIVGLLLGGLLVPLTAQTDIKAFKETNESLADIKDSLLGYAMVNGRLPCPATASSNGQEQPVGGGICTAKIGTDFAVGYLPAATLGISPTDSQGFGVDGWGSQPANRIRYAVSTKTVNAINNPFTTVNGIKNATISSIANATYQPYLKICSAAPTGSVCGGAQLSDTTIFVIYSVGKNAATGGAGDEAANPNPNSADADANGVPDTDDGIFVSRDQATVFDDVVVWVSSATLISRMVSAGQLP